MTVLRLQWLVAGFAAPAGTEAGFGYDEDSARVPVPDSTDGQAPGRVEDFTRRGDVNLAGTDLRLIVPGSSQIGLPGPHDGPGSFSRARVARHRRASAPGARMYLTA